MNTLQPATLAKASQLDEADVLRAFTRRFIEPDDASVVAYLDGNSLGRPTVGLPAKYDAFVRQTWASRLIRAWDEAWMEMPVRLGDRIGQAALGASAGQTVVADSTSVSLYKLIRTALHANPGRGEIVIDSGNFPTDRFVVEGIAEETGASIKWIQAHPGAGVTVDEAAAAVGPNTAVIVLSHVAYRSGYIADVKEITALAHSRGALTVWDLCHSAGAIPIELDSWGVDFATGCTYKYLNGGPGAPAFMYVRKALISSARQPIWGWMGDKNPFLMATGYRPAEDMRRFISGTPPILGMLAMEDMLDLISEAGIDAIRSKSLELSDFAIELYDELLAPHGVELSTPRDHATRGGHVTIDHPAFKGMMDQLWSEGIIPDFRAPTGIRLGLSPLSTTFEEVEITIKAVLRLLERKNINETKEG